MWEAVTTRVGQAHAFPPFFLVSAARSGSAAPRVSDPQVRGRPARAARANGQPPQRGPPAHHRAHSGQEDPTTGWPTPAREVPEGFVLSALGNTGLTLPSIIVFPPSQELNH